MRNRVLDVIKIAALGLCSVVVFDVCVAPTISFGADDDRFNEFEIRVIRPRYFNKKGRFELGAQLTAIMNQTFVYSYMATGLMSFHFSESLGFELAGSYGVSVDKDDKAKLKNTYDIKTQILRTNYILDAALVYTPMYGKYQLSSGRLIYFDTFTSFGVGMSGVQYKFDHCIDPNEDITDAEVRKNFTGTKPEPKSVSYPTAVIGLGQRVFVNKKVGFRWDVRDYLFPYDQADGACTPDAPSAPDIHHNVTLQMGASRFF